MSDPCSRAQIDLCSLYKNRLHCLLFKVRTEKGLYESAKSMAHLILVLNLLGSKDSKKTEDVLLIQDIVHECKMARFEARTLFCLVFCLFIE